MCFLKLIRFTGEPLALGEYCFVPSNVAGHSSRTLAGSLISVLTKQSNRTEEICSRQ